MQRAWLVVVLFACGTRGLPQEAWGTADYVAAGVPDPGHVWSTTELTKAADAIATASNGHTERLPHYQGKRSGDVFARLAAAPADDPAMAIAQRLGDHLTRYEALNRTAKLYANGLGPPPREQLELFGALLDVSLTINAEVDPFLASFAADEPSLQVRREGMATFRKGMGDMLYGHVMVADDKRVSDADRIVVLHNVARSIGPVWAVLPADRREQIRVYLGKLAGATTGPLHDAAAGAVAAIAKAR